VLKYFGVCNMPLGQKSEVKVAKCMESGLEWKHELLETTNVRKQLGHRYMCTHV
jgi:hypothetical protein